MATKKEILKIIKESNLDPASVIHAIEEENGDICAILWSVDDFKDRAFILNKCTGNDYDESKMEGALKEMRRKHDYNIGISWDTVDYFLDEYCLIEK